MEFYSTIFLKFTYLSKNFSLQEFILYECSKKRKGKNWIKNISTEDRQAFARIGFECSDYGRKGGRVRADTGLRDSKGRFIGQKRVSDHIKRVNDGILFITSEKYNSESPRLYTLRLLQPENTVQDVSEFQEYNTSKQVLKAMRDYPGNPIIK